MPDAALALAVPRLFPYRLSFLPHSLFVFGTRRNRRPAPTYHRCCTLPWHWCCATMWLQFSARSTALKTPSSIVFDGTADAGTVLAALESGQAARCCCARRSDGIGAMEAVREISTLSSLECGSTMRGPVQATFPGACVAETRTRGAASMTCISRYVNLIANSVQFRSWRLSNHGLTRDFGEIRFNHCRTVKWCY